MAIQNTDKLIVGRGNDSYQVSLQDSGLALRDDAVLKTGDIMSGNLSLDNNKITNLSIPTNDTDAANKKYVDDAVAAGGGGGGTTSWNDITNKPSTFPPSSHSHSYASTSHNHDGTYVKGNYTITKDSNGNWYIS